MGFGEVLRELVTGEGIVAHQLLLSGSEGAAIFSGVPNARDVGLQVGEDGDLARDGVSGIGALKLCFDLLDGGQRGGVVAGRGRGLGKRHAAYQPKHWQKHIDTMDSQLRAAVSSVSATRSPPSRPTPQWNLPTSPGLDSCLPRVLFIERAYATALHTALHFFYAATRFRWRLPERVTPTIVQLQAASSSGDIFGPALFSRAPTLPVCLASASLQ